MTDHAKLKALALAAKQSLDWGIICADLYTDNYHDGFRAFVGDVNPQVVLDLLAEIDALKARVAELLAANNAEVERRRKADDELEAFCERMEKAESSVASLCEQSNRYLKRAVMAEADLAAAYRALEMRSKINLHLAAHTQWTEEMSIACRAARAFVEKENPNGD